MGDRKALEVFSEYPKIGIEGCSVNAGMDA